MPKVVAQQRRGRASNPRLLDRKSDRPTTKPPRHHHLMATVAMLHSWDRTAHHPACRLSSPPLFIAMNFRIRRRRYFKAAFQRRKTRRLPVYTGCGRSRSTTKPRDPHTGRGHYIRTRQVCRPRCNNDITRHNVAKTLELTHRLRWRGRSRLST